MAERTWMPTTVGILNIVAGAIGVITGIVIAAVAGLVGPMIGWLGIGAVAAPLIVLGIIAIVGGVFALRRRIWGMALAGAICALFPPPALVLGILAIIFVVMAKGEFVER